MPYNPLFGDNFNRADTVVGSGANSTNVGNGWLDFQGNLFRIASNSLVVPAGTSGIPRLCLYRPISERRVSGKVRARCSGGAGLTARFTPENGGSAYGGFLYSGVQWFLYKTVNGTTTQIAAAVPTGVTAPANRGLELTVQQVNETQTQLTIAMYDIANPTVLLGSYTVTDSTAALQNVSGSFGLSTFQDGSWDDFQSYEVSTVLTAGTPNADKVYKTVADISASAATGGVGTISYQWYQSTVEGQRGTAISGATSTSRRVTGLTPGADYWLTLVATDQATTPVSVEYAPLLVSTIPSSGYVILQTGDSITAGVGAETISAANQMVVSLRSSGYRIENVNTGVAGSFSGQWAAGQGNLTGAIAAAQAVGGYDAVSIMIGTNDSQAAVLTAPATYRANLLSQINAHYAANPNLRFVMLNYPPYTTPANGYDSNSLDRLQAYQTEINSLVNGTTVRIGNVSAYDHFRDNPTQLNGGGPHPNGPGHVWLGTAWATAFIAADAISRKARRTFRRGLSFLGSGPRR